MTNRGTGDNNLAVDTNDWRADRMVEFADAERWGLAEIRRRCYSESGYGPSREGPRRHPSGVTHKSHR